jgi:hypothetical protein
MKRKLTDDQLARMRNVDYQRMLRREARKRRKAKEARDKLKWYDDHPDHPKTIAFREARMEAVIAKLAVQAYDDAKRAERLEKRLAVSLPTFVACFHLDPKHPAGIQPNTRHARVETVSGGKSNKPHRWKAYAMGRSLYAHHVAEHLRNTPEAATDRRNAIPASLERVKFMIQRKHSQEQVEGVTWKNYGIFETAGGALAACHMDTGEVFESSQTYAAMIRKLERRRK